MILRRVARPLLAAVFVSSGISALRRAEERARVAEPFLNKTVGQCSEDLPESVPTDPKTLVRVDAGVKIAAGSLLALGKFPRLSAGLLLGSLIPTTAAAHPFWEADDSAEREQQVTQFLKNASLAGGLLLAAADTEGKPSVAWRARHTARWTSRGATGAGRVARRSAEHNARQARKKSQERVRQAQKNARERMRQAQKTSREQAQRARRRSGKSIRCCR